MSRTINLTTALLLVLAVIPASAAASPVLTEGGSAVGVGSAITGTEDGNIQFTTAMGNLTCEKSHLEAEVTSNTGSHVAATIKSATYTNAAGEGCASTIPGVVKFTVKAMTSWCLTSATAGSANLRNGACGKTGGRMKFLWSVAGSECEYQSKAEAINGTYATNTEPLTVAFEEKAPFEKIRQAGFMCPEEMTLDAKYFIETPNGAKLKIS